MTGAAFILAASLWTPGNLSQIPVEEIYGYGSGAIGCAAGISGCSPYTISSTANTTAAGTVRGFFSAGNRYVDACTVSGTVTLSVSNLTVTTDNWTFDLGKCPNQGLQITGRPVVIGTDTESADHWIIRNVRVRQGEDVAGDSVLVRHAKHWAITQSSLQFGGDESLDLGGQGPDFEIFDGTVQYSILGPTLGCDNVLLGCYQGSPGEHNEAALAVGTVDRVTYFRNLIGNGGDDGRNPKFAPCGLSSQLPADANTPGGSSGSIEMVENYIFGTKYAVRNWPDQDCTMYADYIRNVVGESTTQVAAGETQVQMPFDLVETNMDAGGGAQIYALDNMIDGDVGPPADPCDLLTWDGGTEGGVGGDLCDKPQYVAAGRRATHALPTSSALEVVDIVMKLAGAKLPCRDSYDKALLALVEAGTGVWISEGMTEAGGLPTLTTACTGG